MNVSRTVIPEVLVLQPEYLDDERGYFLEAFNQERYQSIGITYEFVQDNFSGSKKSVLRGLHYQLKNAQGKLVHVLNGEIFDVAVDLRRSSPTFGKWIGHILRADDHEQMWIPEGFAHGFFVLSRWAEVSYKVTNYYSPGDERTLLWSDPDIRIDWPIADGESPILSDKDKLGTPLRLADVFA
jgi:dTDP-4-dehydrorhamnose 3,5-epimerase